jgi:putative DNA primase/helicase
LGIRNDHFRLLAADHTDVPDLGTEAGQQALDPLLDGVDLLIVDNISTLCWTGSDNDAGSWTSMQEWILRLRRRGIAVLLVHHSGKSGEQRGTSRREDVLDTVIGLRRPADYQPQQGARFEVHVEKIRAHFGDAGRPFEASLVSTPDGRGLTWSARDLKPSHLEEAAALFRSGVTVRAVAAQLGIARSSAGRLRQKAQEDGLLDSDGESEPDGSEDESGTLH